MVPSWVWFSNAGFESQKNSPTKNLSSASIKDALGSWCSVTTVIIRGGRQVTKAVREAVILSCEYNISVNELERIRVYWQKDRQAVLSLTFGKTKKWTGYENRTILDIPNNLSLVILTLRLTDRGTYSCVVQKPEKNGFKMEHLSSVMLSIRADFPAPSITDLGNLSTNIKRILCSTSGGFPKPHLSWLENGEETDAVNTTIFQDPQTELFTVRSELHFNTTSNHSFKCLIKYGDATVSETFTWQKSQQQDGPDNRNDQFSVSMTCLSTAAVFLVIVFGALACSRFALKWRERRRNEARLQIRTIYIKPEKHQAGRNV
ncbi:T-lymphocyte activation antigen CD80 [Fukomys damarensis]|uniref:T-lymphocyte activation antigen CD80 n=1 Tax=Fukomys damarensis TaxID=885580 RepID=UPI0014554BE5|nr:T-lymphocyte activation antigen CD80 [Fukomys damarensis]